MSCHWELYCRTCDKTFTGLDWNHGEEYLLDFVRANGVNLVGALASISIRGCHGLTVSFEVGPEISHDLIRGCAAHMGHEIAVRSEYGQFSDRCAKSYRCEACMDYHYCKRKVGHFGRHMEIEPETGTEESPMTTKPSFDFNRALLQMLREKPMTASQLEDAIPPESRYDLAQALLRFMEQGWISMDAQRRWILKRGI